MEKEILLAFLKAALPAYDSILGDLEKSNGWLNLNENLIQNAIALKLQWWKAYDDEKLFKIYQLLMFLDLDDIKAIKTEEDALKIREELTNEHLKFINSEEFKNLRPYTDEEIAEMREAMEKMLSELSEEEKKKFWTNVAYYFLGLYSGFFDLLALMIHGKTMRQLVTEAKEGNDDSYCLAVQTDRMVIYLPYFQERLTGAQLGRDADFIDKLGYRFKNPILRGKIRRRTLWLLFALLEIEGQLEMPLKDLLPLCIDVGVYGDQYGVGDENSLGKRRREYYKNRGTRKYF